jgi:hypothetical protein
MYDGRKLWLKDQPVSGHGHLFYGNHVLLASRGYEYDGFLDFLNSIVFISLNDNFWIFLYNFLFVVYFYSNKIWCIKKLVLQYTIKPIDFTGMSTSQSTTHTSQH